MLRGIRLSLRPTPLARCSAHRRPPAFVLSGIPILHRLSRQLQHSAVKQSAADDKVYADAIAYLNADPTTNDPDYHGPLAQTFRRLKVFSISSLGLSTLMTPFLFMIETSSAVPFVGRVALAGTVLMTSGVSTALVAWCGKPYVNTMRWLPSESSGSTTGLEITTLTIALRERITRVYDTAFLVPTTRPFAKWELSEAFKLPSAEAAAERSKGTLPREETIAETTDKDGNVLGRWIVKWDVDGNGTCHETGKIVRYVPNIHGFLS